MSMVAGRARRFAGGLLLCGSLATSPARAWVFPEHTAITQRGIEAIERATTTTAAERRVLALVSSSLLRCKRTTAPCPTLAVLPSLAADHSCSPDELRTALENLDGDAGKWVPGVLEVAKQTGLSLSRAGEDAGAREDIRRKMHIDLQAADTLYIQRAVIDWSHFQIPREGARTDELSAYLRFAFSSTRDSNATAAYANYHLVAIRLADRARTAATATDEQQLLTRAMLAESFALHFLEDSFSTGHFVGHWGDDATRLGTHDFYSRAGFESVRWMDPAGTFVAHGDGFLSEEETRVAALAVSTSLRQVLAAATDAKQASSLLASFSGALGVEGYNSCTDKTVPPGLVSLADAQPIRDVLQYEPVPSPRYPAVPRVRAEKGIFFGGAATVEGGYTTAEQSLGSRIRATLRFGYGAAGLVNDPINAQAFVDLGFVGEYVVGPPAYSVTGFTIRARAPGYLVFVDGAVAIVLGETLRSECPFCINWAAAAAGGGAGRIWKTHQLFGPVTWQLSALREATLNIFRNEPILDFHRTELLTPVVTARSVLPIAGGEGWAQSTDLYLDVGPSFVWSTFHRTVAPGLFASLSAATRLFP